MKRITLILIFLINLLYGQNIELKSLNKLINLNIATNYECKINSFDINNRVFVAVGYVFDDETLKNKACLIIYNIDKEELIKEEIYSKIDSLYKIIPYNDKYFLLGAELLPEDQNIGRSYADKGFTGLLLKLNKDFSIEEKVEINLDGFGNVRDFQIHDNKIVVLTSVKNSTIYDNNLYVKLYLKRFDTNLILLENLELKANDYLANNFYIDKDKYIVTDNYHQRICQFNKNGYIENCLNSNQDNEILKIENLKRTYKKQYEITVFDFNSKYALNQKTNYNEKLNQYINNIHLYKIGE